MCDSKKDEAPNKHSYGPALALLLRRYDTLPTALTTHTLVLLQLPLTFCIVAAQESLRGQNAPVYCPPPDLWKPEYHQCSPWHILPLSPDHPALPCYCIPFLLFIAAQQGNCGEGAAQAV